MPRGKGWFYHLVALAFIFALGGALAWIEFGAVYFCSLLLPSYPGGWPLCHCVFHRASGEYEWNSIAIIGNALACIVLIGGTAFVAKRSVRCLQDGMRVSLKGMLICLTAIAVEIAWLLEQSTISRIASWMELGRYREISSTHALTHWALSFPFAEWCLRATLVMITGCAVYMIISLVVEYAGKAIERWRRSRREKATGPSFDHGTRRPSFSPRRAR
jgi:hypothetical protein